MGYNTESTKWPISSSVSADTKSLIDKLFRTLDDTSSTAGDRLADEIFATDGIMEGAHQFRGAEQIRRSRDKAWDVITKRRHEILQVYAVDSNASDLMLRGIIEVEVKTGKQLKSGFGARLVISGPESESPRIYSYEVFVDLAPVLAALKEP